MRAISAAILLAISSQLATEEALRKLLDFAGPEAAQRWQAVNDGVMGGVSEGRFRITPDKKLEFFGTLSLENNGGFASVRTKPTELNLKAGDAIVVRAKGDGGETKTDAVVLDRRVVRAVGTRAAMRSGSWPTFPMTRWPSSQPPR